MPTPHGVIRPAIAGGTPLADCRARAPTGRYTQPSGWRLVIDAHDRRGAENMAIDHQLLAEAARHDVAMLRVYRWSPPCLSFGRHEPARRRYDASAIDRLGLDTVRRQTGGRAVWHDREVTYAIAGPAEMFGSLPEAYITIHGVVCAALRRMGVAAALAPRPRGGPVRPDAGACFAAPVGGEIVAGGRKLVGSAQIREGGAFLQHGSILLDDGQTVVAQVLRGASTAPTATSLSAVLGRPVSFEEVAAALGAEAASAWPGRWRRGRAEPLPDVVARFADPAWTWRH